MTGGLKVSSEIVRMTMLHFECEILLIVNCEFLYKMQSKESQEKEFAMNNNIITCDHIPLLNRTTACLRL